MSQDSYEWTNEELRTINRFVTFLESTQIIQNDSLNTNERIDMLNALRFIKYDYNNLNMDLETLSLLLNSNDSYDEGLLNECANIDRNDLTENEDHAFVTKIVRMMKNSLDAEDLIQYNITLDDIVRYRDYINLERIEYVNMPNQTIYSSDSLRGFFMNCESLCEVNIAGLTSKCLTDMSEMFSCCYNLKYVNISNMKIPNVKHMESMFENCGMLEIVNMTNIFASRGCNTSNMFIFTNSNISIDTSFSNVRCGA